MKKFGRKLDLWRFCRKNGFGLVSLLEPSIQHRFCSKPLFEAQIQEFQKITNVAAVYLSPLRRTQCIKDGVCNIACFELRQVLIDHGIGRECGQQFGINHAWGNALRDECGQFSKVISESDNLSPMERVVLSCFQPVCPPPSPPKQRFYCDPINLFDVTLSVDTCRQLDVGLLVCQLGANRLIQCGQREFAGRIDVEQWNRHIWYTVA